MQNCWPQFLNSQFCDFLISQILQCEFAKSQNCRIARPPVALTRLYMYSITLSKKHNRSKQKNCKTYGKQKEQIAKLQKLKVWNFVVLQFCNFSNSQFCNFALFAIAKLQSCEIAKIQKRKITELQNYKIAEMQDLPWPSHVIYFFNKII